MKRFSIAAMAALAIVTIFQERASAWFNLSAGGSANFSLSWGGVNRNRTSEPWPSLAYGSPVYNWYGPSNSGPPPFPVNPYGMSTYGAAGGRIVPGQPIPPPPGPGPVPVGPKPGSGAPPATYNNFSQPYGYGNFTPYSNPPMPYAKQVQYQPSENQSTSRAAVPAYWYGR